MKGLLIYSLHGNIDFRFAFLFALTLVIRYQLCYLPCSAREGASRQGALSGGDTCTFSVVVFGINVILCTLKSRQSSIDLDTVIFAMHASILPSTFDSAQLVLFYFSEVLDKLFVFSNWRLN